MIHTNGVSHIALPAADPERAARFYMDLLGMEAMSISPEAAFLRTPGRRDLLAFSRSDLPVVSNRETMHFGFIVEPEQFDVALRIIEQRRIPTVSEPGDREIGRYL